MKKFFILTISVFLCSAVTFSQKNSHPQKTSLSGTEIVRKMAAQYAGADSYQDSGLVQEAKAGGGSRPRLVNSFKTYFARPGKFRFEWKPAETDNRSWRIIWSNSDDLYSLSSEGALERESRGETSIAAAAGVSRGASNTVVSLLATGIGGFRLTQLERVVLVREEKFEGEDCYVVRGYHPLGLAIDLWISKSDSLLRKIRETNADGSYQEEVRRGIKLNAPVNNNTFEFKPRNIAPKSVA
jgi:outer membrane lipoprotein-sorting protein